MNLVADFYGRGRHRRHGTSLQPLHSFSKLDMACKMSKEFQRLMWINLMHTSLPKRMQRIQTTTRNEEKEDQ